MGVTGTKDSLLEGKPARTYSTGREASQGLVYWKGSQPGPSLLEGKPARA